MFLSTTNLFRPCPLTKKERAKDRTLRDSRTTLFDDAYRPTGLTSNLVGDRAKQPFGDGGATAITDENHAHPLLMSLVDDRLGGMADHAFRDDFDPGKS